MSVREGLKVRKVISGVGEIVGILVWSVRKVRWGFLVSRVGQGKKVGLESRVLGVQVPEVDQVHRVLKAWAFQAKQALSVKKVTADRWAPLVQLEALVNKECVITKSVWRLVAGRVS